MIKFAFDSLENKYLKAKYFYDNGAYQKAVEIFSEMLQENSTDKDLWFSYAAALQMNKDYKKAVFAYNTAAFFDKDNAYIYLHAAECYLSLNDKIKANLAFAKAKSINNTKEFQEKIQTLQKQNE